MGTGPLWASSPPRDPQPTTSLAIQVAQHATTALIVTGLVVLLVLRRIDPTAGLALIAALGGVHLGGVVGP